MSLPVDQKVLDLCSVLVPVLAGLRHHVVEFGLHHRQAVPASVSWCKCAVEVQKPRGGEGRVYSKDSPNWVQNFWCCLSSHTS